MRNAEIIRNLKFEIRNGFSGPDADNELGDGQVVLRLRRFKNCDANNSKKRSVGSPAADNRAVS